uniref:Uncharacterized protein n=1 Tax=Bionectria ochroleuca TaxID=29856 RepID=A0A8H7NAG6_BIOOC
MPFSGRNSPGLSGRNSPGPDGPRGRQPEGYFRPGSRNASVRPESRSGSAHPDSRRRLDSMRSTAPEPDRFVRSSSGELLYRGRDGTLYPEMKELREPDPKAAYFPLQNSEPVAEGTVFQAVPLRNTHYRCYQSHKSMLRRNNKLYPLACQTCQKSDTEDRWACTFCSLRICESCMGVLDSNKKDLASLMHSLAGQTPSAS